MNKFTAGPWSYEAYEGDPRYAEHYVKARDHMVAIVSAANHGEWRDSDDEGESEFIANAKLISAAPDLLDALRQCVKWHKTVIGDTYFPIESVQIAIDKATTIQ